jgi:cytochrome c oxidase subunit 4
MAEDDDLRRPAPAASGPGFARQARTIVLCGLALLALMLISLGSAYLRLGVFNVISGLVIAAIKAAIVVWIFMRLRDCGPLIRLAAVAGVGVLAILAGLSGVDYLTRTLTPSAMQRPQQLLPVQAASQPH